MLNSEKHYKFENATELIPSRVGWILSDHHTAISKKKKRKKTR